MDIAFKFTMLGKQKKVKAGHHVLRNSVGNPEGEDDPKGKGKNPLGPINTPIAKRKVIGERIAQN